MVAALRELMAAMTEIVTAQALAHSRAFGARPMPAAPRLTLDPLSDSSSTLMTDAAAGEVAAEAAHPAG